MSHSILAKRNLPVLKEFALSNVLLAFDYDGTLAPIVSTPATARMRGSTRRLLAQVARRYPCVVISGRALDDVSKRLHRVPLWYVFGNHGLEPITTKQHAGRGRNWARQLRNYIPGALGVTIEDKTHTITLHYRHAPNKRLAMKAIDEAVARLPDARALGGTEAVSVVPHGGPDKGIALQHARHLFSCDTSIYVGDDDTDEIAFVSDGADRLLGIRVGATRGSRARYHLKSQADIDILLQALLDLRPPRYVVRPPLR